MRAAKELKTKENAEKMYDLIAIVCCASGAQAYIDGLREMWRTIRDDAVPEFRPDRVKYEGGTPKLPWKQATELMFQQLAVMKKVNYGRQ